METLSQVSRLQELTVTPSSINRVRVSQELALAARTVPMGRDQGSLLPDKGHGAMSQAHPYGESMAFSLCPHRCSNVEAKQLEFPLKTFRL